MHTSRPTGTELLCLHSPARGLCELHVEFAETSRWRVSCLYLYANWILGVRSMHMDSIPFGRVAMKAEFQGCLDMTTPEEVIDCVDVCRQDWRPARVRQNQPHWRPSLNFLCKIIWWMGPTLVAKQKMVALIVPARCRRVLALSKWMRSFMSLATDCDFLTMVQVLSQAWWDCQWYLCGFKSKQQNLPG